MFGDIGVGEASILIFIFMFKWVVPKIVAISVLMLSLYLIFFSNKHSHEEIRTLIVRILVIITVLSILVSAIPSALLLFIALFSLLS